VADQTQAEKLLEVELKEAKRAMAEKEHALSEKENQVTRLQELYDQRDVKSS